MSDGKLIVIGSSAGGVEALIVLVRFLPRDLGVPICIAQHLSPVRSSALPAILTAQGELPVSHPSSGTRLLAGHIFLAPPDHHLSLAGKRVLVTQDQPQRPRPSIDLLFTSAANSQVIGVLLTGMLTDGTAGLQAIKQAGGTTIIQDPQEAAYPSMPRWAQKHCAIDACLPLAQIPALLEELTS